MHSSTTRCSSKSGRPTISLTSTRSITEEVVEELFQFTRHVIYGDNKSSLRPMPRSGRKHPADGDSLHQHRLRANYLAYLARHPALKHHPSPLGHGWDLVDGRCRPVRHDPLSQYICLRQGKLIARQMRARMLIRRREMMVYRVAGCIHRNLMVQNALIQASHEFEADRYY